jgi:hypothetical protein
MAYEKPHLNDSGWCSKLVRRIWDTVNRKLLHYASGRANSGDFSSVVPWRTLVLPDK